ncbi:hypothetical protein ILUMI_23940 [Ignelater luminosus]|uniref:Uncharacterized protein n=1 Tax=Ignelater luminosus TaxID=2038154 RepID=A0A8K0C7X5_IGNLU|nr:hypothetical protein ILUMI_23940 [Ignelater luminosus]
MAKGDAKSTIQHFVKEGRRRTTVSRIIKRYKDTGKTEYAPIPVRPISKQRLKTQKKIETLFTKCPTASVRIVAKKLNIPKNLAICHYAKVCLEFLTQEKLEFIGKHENPADIPQARGIEKFWALCKQKYSEEKNTPKNIGGFKRIWDKISKNVAEELGKTVMDHAYKHLREIGCKGIQNAMCSIYKKQKH